MKIVVYDDDDKQIASFEDVIDYNLWDIDSVVNVFQDVNGNAPTEEELERISSLIRSCEEIPDTKVVMDICAEVYNDSLSDYENYEDYEETCKE